jgi:hypothetical protein
MARYERFTFLCNPLERQKIKELAAILQRSQGDAVRFLVMNVANNPSLSRQLIQPESENRSKCHNAEKI